jgi:hypothetical protein
MDTVTVYEVMLRMPVCLGQRLLSFEEVVLSGRPAIFSDFGDLLAYLDGTVFILKGCDVAGQPLANPPVLDAGSIVRAVGIETGWRHANDCDCDICNANEQAA